MRIKLLITVVIGACLAPGCRLPSYESEVSAVVSGHSWRKTVTVEQLETKTGEAWETELPKNIKKIISRKQAIHHYTGQITQKVPEVRTGKQACGQERYGAKPPYQYTTKYCDYQYTVEVEKTVDDLTKPVYADKIKYEYEEWTEKEKKDLTGYDKNLSGQTLDIDNKTTRLGKSDDSFTVELTTPDNRKYPQSVTREVWEKLNDGQIVKCRSDLSGTLTNCQF